MAGTISATGFSASTAEERSFSLVPGGPLFRLLLRAHMADSELHLVHRRLALAVFVMWAPVMVLAALQGALVGPGRTVMNDIGFQLRFLVAAPLLILAELVVHRRMRLIVGQFRARELIGPGQAARFDDAVADALRWRDSALAEAALLVFVYAAGGLFTLHRYEALHGAAWYAMGVGGGRLSPAGLWLVFISLPLIQFLLLRWYFRLFIWARFLWRMARLDLDLNVTHPDKAAGLGFLGDSLAAFIPIAVAHGVLFSGMIADRIFFAGASLTDFKMQVASGAVLLLVVFAGPLGIFAPHLARVKRMGLIDYGALGERYVREFRDKWLRGGAPPDEPLVGSGDIQSLADLGNSFGNAVQTRFVPVTPWMLIAFVGAFLAPILPLLLTMMSVEKLVDQLAGLVF
ncbi:MAG TPA: hypothetical protein VN694_05050 [Caulobacteraceae bacterium]|nr:hypothetical protein [Caulobacteraceae bacterium]